MRLRLSEVLRLLWGLLLLLALAASPLLALVLLALIPVVVFRPLHRREYGRPSMTLRGEVVRSYSEKVISDWLFRRGIRYDYERPVFDRKGSVISRPDFYLPDLGVCVEYWGLTGTERKYDKTMMWKALQYRRNGVRVVSLFPDELADLNIAFRSKLGRAAPAA